MLIDRLLAPGDLRVHDPEAMENVRRRLRRSPGLLPQRDEALEGADALAILTEWKQFVHPDFEEMRRLMRRPVIFDGRNLYDPARMTRTGSPITASAALRSSSRAERNRARRQS